MAAPTRTRARARTASTTTAGTTETTTPTNGSAALTCPECGRTFSRPAALGAHRSRLHGVAGSSENARSRRNRTTAATTRQRRPRSQTSTPAPSRSSDGATRRSTHDGIDHDALLRVLFPGGIPPEQELIAAVNDWLAQADTLARQR
jgi:hypothetical protein